MKKASSLVVSFIALSMCSVLTLPAMVTGLPSVLCAEVSDHYSMIQQEPLQFQASHSFNLPQIDGSIEDPEWNDANSYEISLNEYQGVGTVTANVYFKHDGTNIYVSLEVFADQHDFDQFIIFFDEGADSYYGSGTRDGILTPNQEDLKACFSVPIEGYTVEDGCYKQSSWRGYWGGDLNAECRFMLDHWESEFSIPFIGNDGGVDDVSDLVCTVSDTIGIKIQYFTQPGAVNYYYPAGDNHDIQTYTTLSFEPSQDFDISAQYSTFASARNNYKQIFGQNVAIGQTVERTLSGIINDPPAHYQWQTWSGHTYPQIDGFSIRIETIQPDYVYKIIGMGHMAGSQPSASGWVQVNSPFEIEQINYVENVTHGDGSYVRIYVDVATGRIDFSAKWYNYPALIDAPAFKFTITIAKPGGTLPLFSYDTTRAQASYAYDTDAERVVMFGGYTHWTLSLNSDVWTLDPATSQWASVYSGSGPSGRCAASMSYNTLARDFLLFGGGTIVGEDGDTWTFQLTGPDTGTWTQIAVVGPSGRTNAPMVYDSKNNLFALFGGERYVYSLGDTWVFDPSTEVWSNKNPSTFPPQRARAAMAYDKKSGKVLLFGGLNKGEGKLLGGTWLYDASTNIWQIVETIIAPSSRLWPSLASDGNGAFYFFGGWAMDENGYGLYLNDTWKFDTATMKWTELFPSTSPPAQSQGTLMYLGSRRFVLVGGWRDSPLGEVWIYDSNYNTWSTAPPPPSEDLCILDVPYQSQDGTKWCALTSLAMVLRYYGTAVHCWDIAEFLGQGRDQGGYLGPDPYGHDLTPRLTGYLDKHYPHYEVFYYRNGYSEVYSNGEFEVIENHDLSQVLGDIESYISRDQPVLLSIKNPSNHQEKHMIVITGFNKTGLFFNDPSGLTQLWAPSYVSSISLGASIHGYITKEGIILHDFDIICTDFTGGILGLETANTGTLLILDGNPSPTIGSLELFSHHLDYFDTTYCSIYINRPWPRPRIYLDLDTGLMWKQDLIYFGIPVGHPILGPQDTMKCKIRVYNHEGVAQTFTVVFTITGNDGITYCISSQVKNMNPHSQGLYEQTIFLGHNLTKTQYYHIQVTLFDSEAKPIDTVSIPDIYYFNFGESIKLEEMHHHLYLHVYDEQGNHVGIDYSANQTEIEIPDAYYFDNENGTIVIVVPTFSNLSVVVDATYAEETVESYNLTIATQVNNETVNQKSIQSTIQKGTSEKYKSKISPNGEVTIVREKPELPLMWFGIVVVILVATSALILVVKRRRSQAKRFSLSNNSSF